MDKDVVYMYVYIYIYTHTHTYGIVLSHKKNKIMSFAATWMDLRDYHTKQSQKEKDEYHMISFIHGI